MSIGTTKKRRATCVQKVVNLGWESRTGKGHIEAVAKTVLNFRSEQSHSLGLPFMDLIDGKEKAAVVFADSPQDLSNAGAQARSHLVRFLCVPFSIGTPQRSGDSDRPQLSLRLVAI